MRTARTVNRFEQELVTGGDAFFFLPSTGHESVAAWNLFLQPEDWVHTHYRDHALWMARGIEPASYFDVLLCNADSYSAGRQMCGFQASRALNMPSTVVPVGNNCLQAVGIAEQIKDDPARPVVLCGLGDGSTQQGEVYEAIAEVARNALPVLFYVTDNGYAISTQTHRNTFFSRPDGPANEFYGLPIHRFDGRDVLPDLPAMGRLVDDVRDRRVPAIAVMRAERLSSHTNADDHTKYRDADEIARAADENDPLVNFRRGILARGVSEAELDTLDQQIEDHCRHAAELSRRVPDPETTFVAKRPLPDELQPGATEQRGDAPGAGDDGLSMIEAMRGVLEDRLTHDERVVLLGEDIEDPKGDVFGVTRGLSTRFPGRVNNTALTESTIIGGAIGRSMAGARPVGFIQFADFLPNGIGQVMSELGSIYWRTNGQFECPVILMVTCGAYRPGLGPFHAHTHESLLAHIPGVDVMMPSTAADAAGMLNAAFRSQRPTIFLYPKVCLNDRAVATTGDPADHLVPIGTARREAAGDHLTLVGWGSTMGICRDVAKAIAEQSDQTVDLWDLRCIDPWDREALAESALRTGRLLVVHEDNLTAGFGAEVVAGVTEDVTMKGARLCARRVARADTYVPCNYANQMQVLPSFRGVLTAACEMMGLDVAFGDESGAAAVPNSAGGDDAGVETLMAEGSSPADSVVTVSEWKVKVGEAVTTGQQIADMEADKAVFEFSAPHDGTIEALLLEEGVTVDVGTPMLKIRAATSDLAADDPLARPVVKRPVREDRGTPVIRRPDQGRRVAATRVGGRKVRCYLSPVSIAEGRDRVTNTDLIRRFPDVTSADIVRRTGIESRPYCAHDQTALSLAVEAATAALKAEGIGLEDLTGIVCHTTTPPLNTPSMACMLLNQLDPTGKAEPMVYDVNAACSGWLYALDAAHNTIQHNPDSAVLVVTTECLSRLVNPEDFGTAILFGDAATATVMRGVVDGEQPPAGSMLLSQPVLAGKADPGGILQVGFEGRGHITMDGKRVFTEAVRAMTKMTNQAFERSGAALDDLQWLVPHQANERIFEAVRQRLKIPDEKIVNLIRNHGNTSSSSIPLSISKSAHLFKPRDIVGVCAFGGGFTFGAAILEIV